MTLALEGALLELMRARGLVSKAELAQNTHRKLSDIDRALKSLIHKGRVKKQVGAQVLYTRTDSD